MRLIVDALGVYCVRTKMVPNEKVHGAKGIIIKDRLSPDSIGSDPFLRDLRD